MANNTRFIHIISLMILVPIPLILKRMDIEETKKIRSVTDEKISKDSSVDTVLNQENIELEERLKCQFPSLKLQKPPGKRYLIYLLI